jgi:hypothetical protein
VQSRANMSNDTFARWSRSIGSKDRKDRRQRFEYLASLVEDWRRDCTWCPGGHEALIALDDAKRSFVYGADLASILAAHAACELFLAGLVGLLSDEAAPKGWQRWGLGRLVRWSVENRMIDPVIGEQLLDLAERRRTIAHFRRPLDEGTLRRRWLESEGAAPDSHIFGLLNQEAKCALEVTLQLFGRAWP